MTAAKAVRSWRIARETARREVDDAPDGRENWAAARAHVAAETRAIGALSRIGIALPSGWIRAELDGELFAIAPDGCFEFSRIVELGSVVLLAVAA